MSNSLRKTQPLAKNRLGTLVNGIQCDERENGGKRRKADERVGHHPLL